MILFCPRGHDQTNLSAMGGVCETRIKEDPEAFSCKDPGCPDKSKGQHFHPSENTYFVDIDNNRVG